MRVDERTITRLMEQTGSRQNRKYDEQDPRYSFK
jgi:hypothetical protein